VTLYLLFIGALLVWAFWSSNRQRERINLILEQWERENGYSIVQRSSIWFSLDPFVMFAGKTRRVYRITVQDQMGTTHEALIRIRTRDWFYQDSCEVKWLD
jgi:hypothetical protein